MIMRTEKLKKLETMVGISKLAGPVTIGCIEYDKDGFYLYKGGRYKTLEDLARAHDVSLNTDGVIIFKPQRLPHYD